MKKDLLYTLSGNATLQVTSIISSIIISIYYTPKDLGNYSLLLLISSILATLYTLRSETLIIIEPDDKQAKNFYHFAQNLSFIMFIITTIVCLLIVLILNDYYFYIFLPFLAFVTSNQLTERETYFRNSEFKQEAIISGARGLINNILQLAFKSIPNSLILSKLISETTYIIQSNLKNKLSIKFSLTNTIETYRANSTALLNLTANRILQNISNNGFYYITTIFFGLTKLGLVTLATKVIQLPANFMGEGLSKIFEKYQLNKDKNEFKYFTIRFYITILAISLITGFSIGTVSYFNFFNILPSKWNTVSGMALILSPIVIANITNAFIISCFKIKKKLTLFNKIELSESFIKGIVLIYLGYSSDFNYYLLSYSILSICFHFIKVVFLYKVIIE
ncbi:hypothetical protein ABMA75_10255 [Halobacteriovorax sp. ZH4_bin.1]|uniref:hypothetical protein n=1 Tax=unclassified Halobacteriovorax TaxID=2639665 RepID=UPI0037195C23